MQSLIEVWFVFKVRLILLFMERMKSIWFTICWHPEEPLNTFKCCSTGRILVMCFHQASNIKIQVTPAQSLVVCLSVCPMEIKEWPRQQSLCRIFRNKCSHLVWLQHHKCKKNEWLCWHNMTHMHTHVQHIHTYTHTYVHTTIFLKSTSVILRQNHDSFFCFSSKSNIKRSLYSNV